MTAEVAAAKLQAAAKELEKNCKDTWKDPEVREAFKLSNEVLQLVIAVQKIRAAQAKGQTVSAQAKPSITASIEPARAVFKLKEAVYKLRALRPEFWNEEMRTAFGAAVSLIQKYDVSQTVKRNANRTANANVMKNPPKKTKGTEKKPAKEKPSKMASVEKEQTSTKAKVPTLLPKTDPVSEPKTQESEKPVLSIWKPLPEATVSIRIDDFPEVEQKKIISKIVDHSSSYKAIWNKAYDVLDRILHETGEFPAMVAQEGQENAIRQTKIEINRLAQTKQYAFLNRTNKYLKRQAINDVESAFRAFLSLRAPYPQKRTRDYEYLNYYVVNYITPGDKTSLVHFMTDEKGEKKLQIAGFSPLSLQNPKDAEGIETIYSSKIGINAENNIYVTFNRSIKLPPDHATDGLTNSCIIQNDENQIENAVEISPEDTSAIAALMEQLRVFEEQVRSREDPYATEEDVAKAEDFYNQIKEIRKKYLVMPAETRRAVQDREEAMKMEAKQKSKPDLK